MRFSETGSIAVKVLFILAGQLFLFLSAIIRYFPDNTIKTVTSTDYILSLEVICPTVTDLGRS